MFTVSSPQEESRMFLSGRRHWSLLVRQVKFSGSVANIPTQLSNLTTCCSDLVKTKLQMVLRTGRDWTGQEVTLLSTVQTSIM